MPSMPIAINGSDIFHLPKKRSLRRGSDTGSGLSSSGEQETQPRKRKSDCFHSFTSWKTMNSSTIKSLREFLKKKSRILSFRAFLQREFSEENLDFWIEVEAYKKQKANKQSKIANVIYEKYIAVNSPREINIDAATRLETKSHMSQPDSNTFEVAQNRVFTMMERDSFRRFVAKEWNAPKEEKRKNSNGNKLKQLNKKLAMKMNSLKRNSSDEEDESNYDKSTTDAVHLNALLFSGERRKRMFTV